MTAFTNFDADDIVEGNVAKNVTSTLFSNGVSTLTRTTMHYSSVHSASAAGGYFWNVYNADPDTDTTAEVQFQISYGHYAGSGSARAANASTTNQLSPTRAIYSQFRNLLLENTSPSSKFVMGDNHNCDRMVFITMNRARFKEQLNVGNWELRMSQSAGVAGQFATSGQYLGLIDDSAVSAGSSENGHKVYNIISGSGNSRFTDGSGNFAYYGKVYPELGILAVNGDRIISSSTGNSFEQSSSLFLASGSPGDPSPFLHTDSANTFDGVPRSVFNSIATGSHFSGRANEDVSSTHFFVRAKNSRYNFSTNETFKTGSAGQLRHTSMVGDPQVFITTVGLYNDTNELVAVAKLSKPLLKNFEREATVRVKLDY